MLSVLAVIGKIIGFTLLGILGLVILILLLVLFVPIRWKADANGGKFEEGVKADAGARVTWLLHLISVSVGFVKTPAGGDGEGLAIAAKVFGIQLFPKKAKKKGKDKDAGADDGFSEAETANDAKPAAAPGSGADAGGSGTPQVEVIQANGLREDGAAPQTAPQEPEANAPAAADTPAQLTAQPEAKPEQNAPAERDEPVFVDFTDPATEQTAAEPEEKEKKTLSQRLDDLLQKKDDLQEKAEDILGKAEKVWDFVTANTTQEELALLLARLGKAAKHYIPKTFEGYVRVGFDDPATTGKILMYWYSLAYPRVPDTFTLTGDFDEEVIEGDLHLKGRIRFNHIVWFGLRMLLDKKFRKLIKRAKRLMKDLKSDDEDRAEPGEGPAQPESGEETRKEEA